MARHISVRHVAGIIVSRTIAMHHELAVRRHGGKGSISIAGIGNLHAIHVDMVGIHVRPHRTDGQRPDAVRTFRKRHRLASFPERGQERHADEPHFSRLGCLEAEGDGAVVMHFR